MKRCRKIVLGIDLQVLHAKVLPKAINDVVETSTLMRASTLMESTTLGF